MFDVLPYSMTYRMRREFEIFVSWQGVVD